MQNHTKTECHEILGDAFLSQVAAAVAQTAIDEGVAQIEAPADLEEYLAARMWKPVYGTE